MTVIAVPAEASEETRLAISPDTAKKYIAKGASVRVERGAGNRTRFTDAALEAAGATLVDGSVATVSGADVVLVVRRPGPDLVAAMKPGAILVGQLDPYGDRDGLQAIANQGVTAFTTEFMPRTTRAQSMDVLSSQANLAGYQAVIEGAAHFDQAMPMMMTAAGTVPAAKVFIMGAGVAGLQAIATARRMGAIVTATDVRPAAKEQVASLGAKFIAVEDEEFKQAETAGGYAKEMSAEYKAKQAELVSNHVKNQNLVITTALIPGRPAPKLVTRSMVESMPAGAVVVDLAAERGGNCELTVPGQVIEHGAVKIVGLLNLPGRIPMNASALYARNLFAFLELMLSKDKGLAIDWADDIIKATALSKDGALIHPSLQPAAAGA